MVESENDIPAAETELGQLAKELGVTVMSDEELQAFTKAAEK